MKKPISIKLDEKLWVYIKNKPNRSRYFEELVKQDLQQAQKKPIVEAVINQLLSDETFFREISERLNIQTIKTPLAPNTQSDASFTPKAPDPVTGYPCCQAVKPCKHWVFDGTEGQYSNQLTGEVRAVL